MPLWSCLDRDAAAAAAAAAGLKGAHSHVLDVANEGAVDDAFGAIGPVDILINCAGIALRHSAIDHSLADWDRVVAVNMTGSFLCARAAARGMIAKGWSRCAFETVVCKTSQRSVVGSLL